MATKTSSLMASVLGLIEHFLSSHEEKYFFSQTENLAKENNKLRRNQNKHVTTGFIFDGIAYVLPEHDYKSPVLSGLEIELEYKMERLLAERKDRKREIKNISQILFLICKDHVHTMQDLRDLLPECVVPAVSQLLDYQRTREPAYSIQDNPSMMTKWEQILPRIEYYTATRLLY